MRAPTRPDGRTCVCYNSQGISINRRGLRAHGLAPPRPRSPLAARASAGGYLQRADRGGVLDKPLLQGGDVHKPGHKPGPSGQTPRTGGGRTVVFDDRPDAVDVYAGTEVQVEGVPGLQPLDTFNDLATRFGVPNALLANMKRAKLLKPTPVQRYAVPAALGGGSLLAAAQTGTGKSAAFLIPVVAQLLRSTRVSTANRAYPRAVVLAPTHELAQQLLEVAAALCTGTHLKVLAVFGGTPVVDQVLDLRGGCDLLVATPGRLLHLIPRRVSLANLATLVVDEADTMLALGFGPALRKILASRDAPPPQARQTLLFSSSAGASLRRMAAEVMAGPAAVITAGNVRAPPAQLITQRIELMHSTEEKMEALAAQLAELQGGGGGGGGSGLTLVFVGGVKSAEVVAAALAARGITASVTHGEMSQLQREEALSCFKFGVSSVLVVSAALAGRGLDIPDVSHVVLYDLPRTLSEYVACVGRTGRAGRRGDATAYFTRSDTGLAGSLAEMLAASGQHVPDWLVQVVQRRYKWPRHVSSEAAAAAGGEPPSAAGAGGSLNGSSPGNVATAAAAGAPHAPSGKSRSRLRTFDGSSGSSSSTLLFGRYVGPAAAATGPGVQGSPGGSRTRQPSSSQRRGGGSARSDFAASAGQSPAAGSAEERRGAVDDPAYWLQEWATLAGGIGEPPSSSSSDQ